MQPRVQLYPAQIVQRSGRHRRPGRRVRCRAAPNAVMRYRAHAAFLSNSATFCFLCCSRRARRLLDSGLRRRTFRIDCGNFRTPRILNPRKCLCKCTQLASRRVGYPPVNYSFSVTEYLNVRLGYEVM